MTSPLSGQRILVTGGNGFLGRVTCSHLDACGATVLRPTSRDLDLLDRGAIRAWLAQHPVDLVLHLAARVGGIGANQRNPATYFHDNLMMGVQLIDECWRARVSKMVLVGTICMYPKYAPVPFREDALWDGYPEETNAPYGLAKKMLLVQSQAYRQQYGFNSVMLLPVNMYGPGDNFDLEASHVIPAIIRKIDAAQEAGDTVVELWGDGSPTREFLYVDDCARALVLAAERYDSSEPVNIGSGEEISIRALAELIAARMGFTGSFRFDDRRPNGQPRRRLDVTRARERLGFEARTPLAAGLDETIRWWRTIGKPRKGAT